MKKLLAMFLIGVFWIHSSLSAYKLELNVSYNYFRGSPDSNWNGNNGAFVSGNLGIDLYEFIGLQAGGSYGVYNWDGRQNLVFKNPKKTLQQAFITTGLFSSLNQFNLGLVYDRQFTNHFSIYDLDPSIDQLRFQAGYQFYREEVGFWGTVGLTTAHQYILGMPISFKAINQINLFWTHFFQNSAMTTLWIGSPYRKGATHKIPGVLTAGFNLRVPLAQWLYIDGHGVYMRARKSSGSAQSKHYGSNICIGITYLFGEDCSNRSSYMPIANNSNFLVESRL